MSMRVVIIGGGFGGLEAAFSLKGLVERSCEIVLIDRDAHHSFIPSIHLIVSGKVTPDEIRIPLDVVLGAAGIRFVRDEALSVNTRTREVLTGGGKLSYDYLLLSSGAESNFFGLPGAEEFSCRFRTPENAERIRVKLMHALVHDASPHVIIAGGGSEGVEVAGEVLDLVRREGREDDLQAGRISIAVIEGNDRLLFNFPAGARDIAERYLRGRGVAVTTGERIAEVRKEGVVLASGRTLDSAIIIWSGGIQPSRLIRELLLPKESAGWLRVTDRLHAPEDDRVYGIGDAVGIAADQGPVVLQRLASHAQDQARVAAYNIAADSSGREKISYKPRTRPHLISLGGDRGIFTLDDRVFSGPWVVTLKKVVERKHLMTYLSKPLSSALSTLPGAGIIRRMIVRISS